MFEIDAPSTQDLKRDRVDAVLGERAGRVRFIAMDFEQDDLILTLKDAGYDPTGRTFFIWEGVAMYLTEDVVRTTLRAIADNAAGGSVLMMDFAARIAIDFFRILPSEGDVAQWREPWIFGVPDGREEEFFAECGLERIDFTTFRDAASVARYLTRADGSKLKADRAISKQHTRTRPRLGLGVLLAVPWLMLKAKRTRSKGYALGAFSIPGK